MATVYSDIGTKQNDPRLGNRVDPLKACGKLCVATAEFDLASGAAANDIVNLVKLPSRAQIQPHLCKIVAEDPGTTLTVDVGDDDDTDSAVADRYADGVDISAGGNFDFATWDAPYTLQKESWIQLKYATAASLTTGATIRVSIAYII